MNKNKDISFRCKGKCRICPYPGANCRESDILSQRCPVRECDEDRIWMDSEFMAALRKERHL